MRFAPFAHSLRAPVHPSRPTQRTVTLIGDRADHASTIVGGWGESAPCSQALTMQVSVFREAFPDFDHPNLILNGARDVQEERLHR